MASSSSSSSKETGSDDKSPSRFIRASTGRPTVITKPPLARFESDLDIDAPLSPLQNAHTRKLENRDPQQPSHFAVRSEDTPKPPDQPPSEKRASGGITAGAKTETDGTRRPVRAPSTASDKWWTFAAGVPLRKRLDDYLRGEGKQPDVEQGDEPSEKREHLTMSFDGLKPVSPHPSQQPGWSSPWAPHRRSYMDDYRTMGPSEGPNTTMRGQNRVKGFFNRVGHFLTENVFAPILLRLLNMAFTCALIGLAARIQYVEDENGINGIIGESTIFALVVGPLTLIHVFIAIYLEYFGPPIGIWRMRTKMAHTLTELVFISLWASLLSLAFDDYFTTPFVISLPSQNYLLKLSRATCTAWTPNARWRPQFGDSNINGSPPDVLCDDQGALVAMVFVGLMLYQAVLVISLFRIFSKVSRK